jgi:hypothetical protein
MSVPAAWNMPPTPCAMLVRTSGTLRRRRARLSAKSPPGAAPRLAMLSIERPSLRLQRCLGNRAAVD